MKKTTIGIGAVLLAGGLVTPLLAFELINPARKWFQGVGGGASDLPVTFLINQNGEESVTDGDNGVTAVMEAAELWEPEMENNINLMNVGTTPSNAVGNDGQNVTSFNDPARIARGSAIAVTLTGFYDSGQSETVNGINFARWDDADISFSSRLNFTTENEPGGCSNEYDIQAVMTHEMGHALGLGHSGVGSALMAPSVSACTFKRIAADDHNGINTIYNPGFGGGSSCTPTEYNLTQHSCSAPNNGPNCLVITIGVSDDCGNGASGATVTVQLSGNTGDVLTGSAATDGSGTVSFALRCRDASSTVYTSTVLSITGGLSWSAGDPDNTASVTINSCATR